MQNTRHKIRVMSNERRATDSGLTLIEMTVVIVIAALLTSFALPAVRMLFNSFQSQSGTRAMISAALASARAIAAEHQRYAGIRFQNKYQPDGKGAQYMIFIIHDSKIGPGKPGNLGFRAMEGIEPIKLPDSVGVIEEVYGNDEIDEDSEVTDKTTFSVIFSPSGKLVIHTLWVKNRDGDSGDGSEDDIFNSENNVKVNGIGMFIQDKDTIYIESSRNSFVIYDRTEFDKVDVNRRWSDYLCRLERIYINPYTGTMIR